MKSVLVQQQNKSETESSSVRTRAKIRNDNSMMSNDKSKTYESIPIDIHIFSGMNIHSHPF